MSDAQDEVLAMNGRSERRPLPVPAVAESALSTAAAMFRRLDNGADEEPATDDWIIGDAGPVGALRAQPRTSARGMATPSEVLALRELAARLDGGMPMDEAG